MDMSGKRLVILLCLTFIGVFAITCATADEIGDTSVHYDVTKRIHSSYRIVDMHIVYFYKNHDSSTKVLQLNEGVMDNGDLMVENTPDIIKTQVSIDLKFYNGGVGPWTCHHIHQFTTDGFINKLDIIVEDVDDTAQDTMVILNGNPNIILFDDYKGSGFCGITTNEIRIAPQTSLISVELDDRGITFPDLFEHMYIIYTFDNGETFTVPEVPAPFKSTVRAVPNASHIRQTNVIGIIDPHWGFYNIKYCRHIHRFIADRYISSVGVSMSSKYLVGKPDDTTVTVNRFSNTVRGGKPYENVYSSNETYI